MVPLCPTLFCPKLITQFTAQVHKFLFLFSGRSQIQEFPGHALVDYIWLVNTSQLTSRLATYNSFVLFIIRVNNIWVRCTINRSHSTPCKKAEFEHLQIFPGHCLDFFLSVSGKICHSPIKKVKKQPTLIISFSQHSPFFGEQSKNPGWNPTRVRRYLGSVLWSLWQNSPHKDAFFCISLTNIDQCWITCTFKVE